jgi:heat shock protein HtpX
MTRILLFIATNLAVMVLISITFQILGIEGLLAENGADLNLYALLVMSAVIGFGGAFISLAISKWSAKRFMGVHVIETATNQQGQWLLDIVSRQAPQVGIGMPEVGIFQSDDINAFATGMNKNNALVAVSTGLLQRLNADEVEAVMAHEISHVANGDIEQTRVAQN